MAEQMPQTSPLTLGWLNAQLDEAHRKDALKKPQSFTHISGTGFDHREVGTGRAAAVGRGQRGRIEQPLGLGLDVKRRLPPLLAPIALGLEHLPDLSLLLTPVDRPGRRPQRPGLACTPGRRVHRPLRAPPPAAPRVR